MLQSKDGLGRSMGAPLRSICVEASPERQDCFASLSSTAPCEGAFLSQEIGPELIPCGD